MNVLYPFCGTLTLEITSASPEKALEEIMLSNIPLSNITKKTELIYQFQINHKDYSRIRRILQQREEKLVIVSRHGVYWSARALFKRPVLIILIWAVFALTCFLPSRIFFIEVEGNRILSDQQIISAAEQCGLSFGTSRKAIRSETLKNALLSRLPQLQWAGINTYGCRGVISVRERSEPEPIHQNDRITSIVADRDAFILSATVTAGTAMVRPGDSVMEGQTMISGYADHGLRIQTVRASGEILGLTNRSVSVVMPEKYLQINGNPTVKREISLLIRKKRINLWKDSRISDASCGRMYEEYFVSLPGGFPLPIAICIDRYLRYETVESQATETESYPSLQQFSDAYLLDQMTAGQILQKQHQTTAADGLYRLDSSYICSEYIGREQIE